jgi:hypothetical protein
LDNLYLQLLDNYRSMQRAIEGTKHSGPKRRNKKAERKAEQKAAIKKMKTHKDMNEPLPETTYSIELEMYHHIVRGILRVHILSLSFSFSFSHSHTFTKLVGC